MSTELAVCDEDLVGVSLEEWTKKERETLENFVRHWKDGEERNPKHYAGRLPSLGWESEYGLFREYASK